MFIFDPFLPSIPSFIVSSPPSLPDFLRRPLGLKHDIQTWNHEQGRSECQEDYGEEEGEASFLVAVAITDELSHQNICAKDACGNDDNFDCDYDYGYDFNDDYDLNYDLGGTNIR